MEYLPLPLLTIALWGYAIGATGGILFVRRERFAAALTFGCASFASLCGALAAVFFLANGSSSRFPRFELFPSQIPYITFSVRLDPLGAFFLLIVSLLGFALSSYSLGYARGFFGRKSVGVLGAFYNALLLATTLTFLADNIWRF